MSSELDWSRSVLASAAIGAAAQVAACAWDCSRASAVWAAAPCASLFPRRNCPRQSRASEPPPCRVSPLGIPASLWDGSESHPCRRYRPRQGGHRQSAPSHPRSRFRNAVPKNQEASPDIPELCLCEGLWSQASELRTLSASEFGSQERCQGQAVTPAEMRRRIVH